jgi:hypothetical protein
MTVNRPKRATKSNTSITTILAKPRSFGEIKKQIKKISIHARALEPAITNNFFFITYSNNKKL